MPTTKQPTLTRPSPKQKRALASAKKGKRTAERAKFWACELRAMQRMLAASVPVDSPAEMVRWYAGLAPKAEGKIAPAFRARLYEESAKLAGTGSRGAQDGDDLQAFEAEYKPASNIEEGNLADIKKERAYYLFKMRRARLRGDLLNEKYAANQFRLFSDSVHDCELRAQKLGRDMGDLVPRAELEAPARFLAYHLLRCADAALNDLVGVLTKMNTDGKPLTAEQIREAGEPILLTSLLLQPMVRAMAGDNSAAPPSWLVAALKEGMEEVIEQPAS